MKKDKNIKYCGFTLIEVLVVVSIISILTSIVMVSLNNAKLKAKDASFKSTASSINTAVSQCCLEKGSIQNKVLSGGGNVNICDPNQGMVYPDDNYLGSLLVNTACSDDNYQFVITPGVRNLGNCIGAVFNQAGVVSYNGC